MIRRIEMLILFAAAFGSGVASGQVMVADIIENVRANEGLFDNIEATLRSEYKLLREPVEFLDQNTHEITRSDEVVKYTLQQGMFRLELDKRATDTASKLPEARRRLRLFDGQKSRARQGRIVNIADGFTNDEHIIRPHMMIVQHACFDVPLSVYLSGSHAIGAFLGRKEGQVARITVAYRGEETIDGHRCQKVVCQQHSAASGEVFHEVHLWLAPDRNWLPLKCQTFRPLSTKCVYQASTTEFQEVDRAIWIPKRGLITVFDKDILRARGEQVPAWQQSFAIDAFSLNPAHPVSYFQEFDIPAGSAVYQLDAGGKIVGSYLEGAPDRQGQSPFWRHWSIWVNIAVIMGLAALLIWRKSHFARTRSA